MAGSEGDVAQLYITLQEAYVFEGPAQEGVKMDYLLGIRRHVGGRGGHSQTQSFFAPTLIHAQEVPAEVLGEPESVDDLIAQGVCAGEERQVCARVCACVRVCVRARARMRSGRPLFSKVLSVIW